MGDCVGVGLVHISQLANHRVESIDEVVKAGDPVYVQVLAIQVGPGLWALGCGPWAVGLRP